ncbi:MAG: Uma2 family endonuclease [Isosphaera sp.]|nr:Uma2 family endonuclease [Isosphaera sp.]
MAFTPSRPVPASLDVPGFYRLTVAQYRKMIAAGILHVGDPVELLEGLLVNQPRPYQPPVAAARTCVNYAFLDIPLSGWHYRCATAVTIEGSEPEPDFAVVRGDLSAYRDRFPGPAEVGVVGEVCDTSLAFDRRDKGRIYARAGISVYWIVNIPDRRVEVYADPDPAADPPAYRTRTDYRPGDSVPLVLDGATAGAVPVADLIP